MSYRDDRDADQARIHALEGELAIAKQKVAELEGRNEQALVLASGQQRSAAKRWLGAPTQLELERTFDGTFPPEQFEALVEHIRELTRDRGRIELMRSSVAWWASNERGLGPATCVIVTIKDGKTILRVTDKLGQLAGAVYGGIGGFLGGGGVGAAAALAAPIPILMPFVLAAWFGGSYALARTLFKRNAKKRAQQVQRLFARVEAAVAKGLRSPVELANEESRELPGEQQRALAGETT